VKINTKLIEDEIMKMKAKEIRIKEEIIGIKATLGRIKEKVRID